MVKITNTPLPDGIKLFVGEKAITVSLLFAILKPDSPDMPPYALIISTPVTLNWYPPISRGESYKISKWVSVKLPNEILPSRHHVPSPLQIPHSS